MSRFIASLIVSVCSSWNSPQVMGHLDHTEINEASGLVALEDSLYHINDSGNSAVLFRTDLQGRLKEKIKVKGVKVEDWEDLQLGPCGSERCFFIGDIGDNKRRRTSISMVALREKDVLAGGKVKPYFQIEMKYPDQPHNSEAFVVDAQGNIFLFTKVKAPFEMRGERTQIYRLLAKDYSVAREQQSVTLEFWTDFSLENVVTGAGLSGDGKRLAVLSYSHLIELEFDSNKPSLMSHPVKFGITRVNQLPQPEAVAYFGDELIVTSEAFGDVDPAFMKLSCQR